MSARAEDRTGVVNNVGDISVGGVRVGVDGVVVVVEIVGAGRDGLDCLDWGNRDGESSVSLLNLCFNDS